MVESKDSSNKQMRNGWKYLSFVLIGILAFGITIPSAAAATDVTRLVQQILDIVKSPVYGNQAIMNAIGSGASQTSVDSIQSGIDDVKDSQYVPFSVITSNSTPFVCVAEDQSGDDDDLSITSSEPLMITSVIFEPINAIETDDGVFVPFLTIDGHKIFLPITSNQAPSGNTNSNKAFDIMTSAVNYPHQVAGKSIIFEVHCGHTVDDPAINFEKIIVSGWKKAGETVTVSYTE